MKKPTLSVFSLVIGCLFVSTSIVQANPCPLGTCPPKRQFDITPITQAALETGLPNYEINNLEIDKRWKNTFNFFEPGKTFCHLSANIKESRGELFHLSCLSDYQWPMLDEENIVKVHIFDCSTQRIGSPEAAIIESKIDFTASVPVISIRAWNTVGYDRMSRQLLIIYTVEEQRSSLTQNLKEAIQRTNRWGDTDTRFLEEGEAN